MSLKDQLVVAHVSTRTDAVRSKWRHRYVAESVSVGAMGADTVALAFQAPDGLSAHSFSAKMSAKDARALAARLVTAAENAERSHRLWAEANQAARGGCP